MSTNELLPTTTAALLDYASAQAYLGGLSRSSVKALAGHGEIKRITIGTRTMFLRSSLDAYIMRLTEAQE